MLANMDAESKEVKAEVAKELTNTVAMIPLGEIEVNPWQPRKEFDEEGLAELAESLKVHGLIQPLTVRRLANRQYQLISGERRLRASKLAGLTEVPAYVRIVDNDQHMIEMALVENIQRENLNALEVAIGYKRLLTECELTHDTLAERVGKKRTTVTNYLRLLELAPSIQKALQADEISMGHGKALAGLKNVDTQLTAFAEVMRRKLTVRATEELVDRYKNPQPAKAKTSAAKTLSSDYQAVENNLQNQFGAKVSLKVKTNGSGSISIPFKSTKDLNRLLDLMED